MKQKYTITIADVQMNIVTDETPETVENLVGILDRRIREIYLQSGNRCPKNEAALLCALDYCAERNKLQETVSRLEAEIEKNETEALRSENTALAQEVSSLREQLANAEAQCRDANADVGIAGEQLRILTQKTVETEAIVESLKSEIGDLEASLAEKDAEITRLTAALEEKPDVEALVAEITKDIAKEATTEIPAEKSSIEEAPVETVAEETPAEVAAEEATAEEVAAEAAAEIVAEEAPAEKAPIAEIADSSLEAFEIELKPLRTPVDENQLTIDSVPAEKPAEKPEEKPAQMPEASKFADGKTLEKEKQKAQKRVRSMFDLITFDNV